MAAIKATFIVACIATILQHSSGFVKPGHHIFDKFAALAHFKHPVTTAAPPRPDPVTIITFPTYTDTNPTDVETPTLTDPFGPTVIETVIDTNTNDETLTDLNGNDAAGGSGTDTPIDTPDLEGVVPVANNGSSPSGTRSLNDESDNDIIELDEEDLSEVRATSSQQKNKKKRKPNKRNRRRKQQIKFSSQQLKEWRKRQNQRRRQAELIQRRRDERKRLLRIINLLNQSSSKPLKIRIRRIPARVPLQYFQ